jgi:GntR family transcriptional regulator
LTAVPIYLQLMEQVKHAIETGALRPGDRLAGSRPLVEELVINPNTVAKSRRGRLQAAPTVRRGRR